VTPLFFGVVFAACVALAVWRLERRLPRRDRDELEDLE
jgi:hypothetical protein